MSHRRDGPHACCRPRACQTCESGRRRANLAGLGLSRHRLYAIARAGEREQIAPGFYARPGELDDTTTASWASISLRKPSATICLLSALSLHELTDQIPQETDVALPRGERTLATRFTPIRWHSFDRVTFVLGQAQHPLTDVFRLRHEIGADIANEALKRWRRRGGALAPATLLALARSFPQALPAVRLTLQILL